MTRNVRSEVLLALGSNLDNRRHYLEQVLRMLGCCGTTIVDVASCYESEPLGGVADQRFLNTVICCQTDHLPQQFFATIIEIEKRLGRRRGKRWDNRPIDLDILLWHQDQQTLIVDRPTLQIPHPRMLQRDFVLRPACDIAGHWQHPLTKTTLSEELAKISLVTITRKLRAIS